MKKYQAIWGGDEAGIWQGQRQVLSARELDRFFNTSAYIVARNDWSDAAIANMVAKVDAHYARAK